MARLHKIMPSADILVVSRPFWEEMGNGSWIHYQDKFGKIYVADIGTMWWDVIQTHKNTYSRGKRFSAYVMDHGGPGLQHWPNGEINGGDYLDYIHGQFGIWSNLENIKNSLNLLILGGCQVAKGDNPYSGGQMFVNGVAKTLNCFAAGNASDAVYEATTWRNGGFLSGFWYLANSNGEKVTTAASTYQLELFRAMGEY